ncbi:Beta-1,3-galactosyltransferase 5 [Acipenser ruthenus]|uniref:Hexosyltransferase n=1 Tax=Acipenser ruthenus TaxID=7906 RepID=A0A662YVN7_ACIRT|nr:Beta-1,3-galactosyltransferase 5 [Acipenser ruthenus]
MTPTRTGTFYQWIPKQWLRLLKAITLLYQQRHCVLLGYLIFLSSLLFLCEVPLDPPNQYGSILNMSSPVTLSPWNHNCSSEPPFLVILVTSEPYSFIVRKAIRSTWAKNRVVAGKPVLIIFLLGSFPGSSIQQVALAAEDRVYGDVLQRDFVDSYYNLTLKTLMGLQWVAQACPGASYVFKTDSDVFVNIQRLLPLLLRRATHTHLYTGRVSLEGEPVRNPNSKYYVSKTEFPFDYYPPFCSGTGYVLSMDLVWDILTVSPTVREIKLEDVFIGMCLNTLGVQPSYLSSVQVFYNYMVPFHPCPYSLLVTSHGLRPAQLHWAQKAVERVSRDRCFQEQLADLNVMGEI